VISIATEDYSKNELCDIVFVNCWLIILSHLLEIRLRVHRIKLVETQSADPPTPLVKLRLADRGRLQGVSPSLGIVRRCNVKASGSDNNGDIGEGDAGLGHWACKDDLPATVGPLQGAEVHTINSPPPTPIKGTPFL
jgi:hypothetical protein